ncbi:hypothetical protein LCGC14_0847020 [marine sediment metagenome]|uniref:Uncharacterized protein n=1 Tax=marine sediment metagenome TaxID=412755 RepID=A0A0F9PWP4_9ZZZZ
MPAEWEPIMGLGQDIMPDAKVIVELRPRHCEAEECHYCGSEMPNRGYMLYDLNELTCNKCVRLIRKFGTARGIQMVVV